MIREVKRTVSKPKQTPAVIRTDEIHDHLKRLLGDVQHVLHVGHKNGGVRIDVATGASDRLFVFICHHKTGWAIFSTDYANCGVYDWRQAKAQAPIFNEKPLSVPIESITQSAWGLVLRALDIKTSKHESPRRTA